MGLTQITTLAWIALAVLAAAPAPAAAATGACASEQLLAPAAAWAGAASASASAGEKFTYDFTQTRAAWGPVTVVTLYYKAASACLDGAALTFGPADGGAGGAPAAAAAPGGVERIQSTVKALGAPHVGVSRGLFIQARTLSLAPGDRITRVDLKASGKCIQWMRLVTAKGAAVAAGAAPPAARMQTLAAPAGAYLYTLNARTAIADNGPLEQIQPVWATCAGPAAAAEAGPSSAAPAPVLAPAPGPAGSPAPAFQLSSCRKTTPTACDVSGAASGKGMCAGQQWQADACRAAGLGNNLPQLACQGVQTPATYKLAVKANNGTTQPTPDCSNLACRLRARGCRADPSNSTFCWGTVVRADADAPLSALAAGYLGYPCLDKQTAEVTDAASGYSNFNVLRPGQEGVYAKGYWQACDCTAPAGIDWQADNDVRDLASNHYWATHCEAGDLLQPLAATMCAAPGWVSTKTAAQWGAELAEKRQLRVRVTDPGYLSSPDVLKQRALEQQRAARGEAMRKAWCDAAPAVGLLLPFTLVFPPLTMAMAMSFDSC